MSAASFHATRRVDRTWSVASVHRGPSVRSTSESQRFFNDLKSHPLGNSSPYDEFVRTYGYEGRQFLSRLGIAKIPANEITLDPYVLGKKFKRHADRVILRQNGVTK